MEETDVWSYRHRANNEPFVDSINDSVRTVQEDFPFVMDALDSVSASELGGEDRYTTLGYYGGKTLGINRQFTNIEKMNEVFDSEPGFHPSRGSRNGTEAVTFHELGHALTDAIAQKAGLGNIDNAAKMIVKAAYKKSGIKGGNIKLARQISGYAQKNYSECVAEAVADWYCNGSKASNASKLIMAEIKRYT